MEQYIFINDSSFVIKWFELSQKWDDNIKNIFETDKELGLRLSWSDAWTDECVCLLSEIPWLKYLKVIDRDEIKDYKVLTKLKNLLLLNIVSYIKKEIDFTELPKLKACFFGFWSKGFNSITSCKELRYLSIYGYTGKSFNKLSNLDKLTQLSISHPHFYNFEGINKLTKLTKLTIVGQRINTIEHLAQLEKLEKLDIANCKKLSSIESICNLINLKYLSLDNLGEIKSLTPISSCLKLEILGVRGSTNVLDGDLGFLLNMPSLKLVVIGDRKHYSHKHDDFLHLRPDDENWRKPPKRIKL